MNCPCQHRRGIRFAITAPLLYREHGTLKWHAAKTVNVSHSGVLFRVSGEVPRQAQRLDFILTLPRDGGSTPAHVRGTGHVVRMEPNPVPGGGHAVAVSIDGYALEGRLPA